jgi:spermidine/putrescine transport system substrate-binding protein
MKTSRSSPATGRDDKLHSVMVRCGHLGVSYNKNAVTAEEAMSYKCFWKPELKGKVGHFDWHLPSLGMMSLTNGNGAGLWDLDDAKWAAVQETTMSLRPQAGGFFDYGGTFNSLKNGEMQAMCGIGDWITGVLRKTAHRLPLWCRRKAASSGPRATASARARRRPRS